MLKKLLFCLVMVTASIGFDATIAAGTENNDQEPDRYRLISLMHTFEREMTNLRPYLASDTKFNSEKARPAIQKSIDNLVAALGDDRPTKIQDNSNFSLNFSMMSYHLRQTKRVFEKGGFELARRNLNATTNMCITCHTQMPLKSNSLGGMWDDPKSTPTTFENAEFLFITRRFETALEKYDELARKYPKSDLNSDQISIVYSRKAALFARVLRDPKMAVANFKKDLENKNLPIDIQENLNIWIKSFEAWSSESVNLGKMTTESFLEYVRKILPTSAIRNIAPSDPDLIRNLRVSGLLYDHLMKAPNGGHAQEILYSLAIFEKQLSKLYWYSLYQSYLRECVIKFPKKPMTKTCFDTYEADVTEQFGGQMRAIPDEIQGILSFMKKKL